LENCEKLERELRRMKKAVLPPSAQLNERLASIESEPLTGGISVEQLLRRPEVHYADIAEFDAGRSTDIDDRIAERAEIEIKYAGYIARQISQIEKQKKLETVSLPDTIDYKSIAGLRLEAADKLSKVRPQSVGQASRISGVNPADIAVLTVWLRKQGGDRM
jgi:tRNA uridine 5-carboxymethylaminomethyl modification enzyme